MLLRPAAAAAARPQMRALLLQALYSVRSERLLMEQLDYNLLFRWFVGLNLDDAIWDVTVFTKNRERLLDGDIAEVSGVNYSFPSTTTEIPDGYC